MRALVKVDYNQVKAGVQTLGDAPMNELLDTEVNRAIHGAQEVCRFTPAARHAAHAGDGRR